MTMLMSHEAMLAYYLLVNRMELPLDDWTVQRFGFMRLRINTYLRLHIWDSRLRVAGVSDIHDHAQWSFTSVILSGHLINTRYHIDTDGRPHNMMTIKCGIGGGLIHDKSTPEIVSLVAEPPEPFLSGESYGQAADVIHRTFATDGTVTLLSQTRRDVDTARVFWPGGGAWGDAKPRPATEQEVNDVGAYALSVWG